jgi:uncharacterized phage infection (PIP) family protein YhgE
MANAGRVELNLVAIGEDQLSAMLLKLEGQTKKTTDSVEKTAAAVNNTSGGLSNLTDRVKGSIAGVDKLRSTFNNVAENMTFLTVGITGVVAGIASIVSAVTSGAYREWVESSRNLPESFERVSDLIRDIDVALGNVVAVTEWERAAKRLQAEYEKLGTDLEKAQRAELEQRYSINALVSVYGRESQIVKNAQLELTTVLDSIVLLEKERNRLADRQTQIIREQKTELAGIAQGQLARTAVGALRDQLTAAGRSPKRVGVGAGAAPDPLEGVPSSLLGKDSLGQARGDEQREATRSFGALIRDIVAEIDAEEAAVLRSIAAHDKLGDVIDKASTSGWGDLRDEIKSTTDTMLSFLSVIDEATQAAFPDLGAALQELGSIAQDYQQQIDRIDEDGIKRNAEIERALKAEEIDSFEAATQKRLNAMDAESKKADATALSVINGSTAVVAGLAKELGGLREYYLVKSAGSLAAAFETSVSNPALSASYFTAAAMYGVAAARAGGGGGGGGASAAGRPSTGSGGIRDREGGSGTSVINISTMVTDRAAVRRTVGAILARRDRSGYSAFGGS